MVPVQNIVSVGRRLETGTVVDVPVAAYRVILQDAIRLVPRQKQFSHASKEKFLHARKIAIRHGLTAWAQKEGLLFREE